MANRLRMSAVPLAALAATRLSGPARPEGEEAPAIARVEGKHVVLAVRADDLSLLEDPAAWVAKLDLVYEALADLVGGVPFDGEKITILSVEEGPGGWAVAGNPIRWGRQWIPECFTRSVNRGDWVFGILHELSHDFELEGRWDWGPEFWANYKLEYVFDRTKCVVFSGTGSATTGTPPHRRPSTTGSGPSCRRSSAGSRSSGFSDGSLRSRRRRCRTIPSAGAACSSGRWRSSPARGSRTGPATGATSAGS